MLLNPLTAFAESIESNEVMDIFIGTLEVKNKKVILTRCDISRNIYELKDADFETLLNTRDPEEKYNAAGREKELESFYTKIRVYLNNDLLNQIDNIIRKYKRVFSGKTFRIDKGYNDGS